MLIKDVLADVDSEIRRDTDEHAAERSVVKFAERDSTGFVGELPL